MPMWSLTPASRPVDWRAAGQLLDHIGGHINPLYVIRKIPLAMPIDRLRERLRAIIADYRTQTSLSEGCNAILASDCLSLMAKLQAAARRALPVVYLQVWPVTPRGGGRGGPQWLRCHTDTGAVVQLSGQDVPVGVLAAAATAGGGTAAFASPGRHQQQHAHASPPPPPPPPHQRPVGVWVGLPAPEWASDAAEASPSQPPPPPPNAPPLASPPAKKPQPRAAAVARRMGSTAARRVGAQVAELPSLVPGAAAAGG